MLTNRTSRPFLHSPWEVLAALLLTILVGLYWAGIAQVPFHPDEATNLYMSADIDWLLTNPARLFWQPNSTDAYQKYRELDAPLTRYLAGIGRRVANLPPLPADWDWTKTWAENQQAGALPSDGLLLAGRWPMALLLPLSLWLIGRAGHALGGRKLGWLAALLLALNALTWLHTRRVMAEGLLIFSVCWALYAMLKPLPAWAIAIPVAVALNAKYSTAALIPLGLLVLLLASPHRPLKRRVLDSVIFCLVIGGITLLLNPFLWSDPLNALQSALAARADLVNRQVEMLAYLRPDLVLATPADRIAGLLAHLFFTPPAIADVGNYLAQTSAAEQAYFSFPMHTLLRDLAGGSLLLALSLSGLVLGLLTWIRRAAAPNPPAVILLAGTLLQAIALAAAVPLPFQRYGLPLLPFLVLWQALAITWLIGLVKRR